MKKLIKHLRKDWYRYVLDIFVVFFGIMIAFNLNSWSESKKNVKVEQQYYKDLLQELETDLGQIKGNKEYNQHFMSRYRLASEIIMTDSTRQKVETLGIITTELLSFSDFKNSTSAYEALSENGNLDLINNKNILSQLQNLGNLYTYINTLENTQREANFQIIPMVLEYVRINPFKVMLPESLYTYRFQNNFEIYIRIGNEKEELYTRAENEIQELLKSLRSELKG